MSLFRATWLVFSKDVQIEWRTREIITSTGLFATLSVLLASFAFYLSPVRARELAPGALWLPVTFAGTLAMGRLWARERENGALDALLQAPIPRASIYLGKLLSTTLFMGVIELIIAPLVALFFHLGGAPGLPMSGLLLFLGTLGFAAAGTLFSALTVRTAARDLMLSVVLFPLSAPILLAAVSGTRNAFDGQPFDEGFVYVAMLLAGDAFFLALGLLLFGRLVDES